VVSENHGCNGKRRYCPVTKDAGLVVASIARRREAHASRNDRHNATSNGITRTRARVIRDAGAVIVQRDHGWTQGM